jgi:hypothetical protein
MIKTIASVVITPLYCGGNVSLTLIQKLMIGVPLMLYIPLLVISLIAFTLNIDIWDYCIKAVIVLLSFFVLGFIISLFI